MIVRREIDSLEFKSISFCLEPDQPVLTNVDFKFPLQGIVWVKSKAGAGKSSLFRILDGLCFANSGEYLVNGNCISKMSFEEFNEFRLNIGYSFNFGGLINNRSLYQNLSLPLEYHNIFTEKERKQQLSKIMKVFGIEDVASKRPSAVPGAIRKALCVARAFVHQPQVLLLDEPSSGLRSETEKKLKQYILEYCKKNPNSVIFIASDNEDFIGSIADHQVYLNKSSLELLDVKKAAA